MSDSVFEETVKDSQLQLEAELCKARFLASNAIRKLDSERGLYRKFRNILPELHSSVSLPERIALFAKNPDERVVTNVEKWKEHADRIEKFLGLKDLREAEQLIARSISTLRLSSLSSFHQNVMECTRELQKDFSDFNSLVTEIEEILEQL